MKLIRLPQPDPAIRVVVAGKCSSYFLPLCDIIYCKADRNYTILHTTEDAWHIVSHSLGRVAEILARQGFILIHKSYLVNGAHSMWL